MIGESKDLPPAKAASMFAALGSEQRLAVLEALVRAGPEGLATGELGGRCGITGATLTHHLKTLTGAGLITQARKGRLILCAAAEYGAIERLSSFLLENCCAETAKDGETCEHKRKGA